MCERLTPKTLDLEVRGSSLAHRVVSLDKELYSTLSLFNQAPVVRKVDKKNPLDKLLFAVMLHNLTSALSGRNHYPTLDQLGPEVRITVGLPNMG